MAGDEHAARPADLSVVLEKLAVQRSAAVGGAAVGGAAASESHTPQMTEAPASNQWNGSTYQYYDPVPQEMPTLGYGKSVRRAEKDGNSVPVSHEVAAERDPVELG